MENTIELFNSDFLGLKVNDNKVVVSSRDVARVFEKEHSKVLRAINDLECDKSFTQANFGLGSYEDSQGQERPEYLMTRDGFTLLAMGFTGSKAMQFKIKYIEAFNSMEQNLAFSKLPDFNNPVLAARAWADQVEEKQKALAERDEAVRTKSQISTRSQAQAMATASRLSRENHKLKYQLAMNEDYRAVKAIEWLPEYFILDRPVVYSIIGKELKKFCFEHGYEVKSIPSQEYGKICTFHREAIEAFRQYLNECPGYLSKYRTARINWFPTPSPTVEEREDA